MWLTCLLVVLLVATVCSPAFAKRPTKHRRTQHTVRSTSGRVRELPRGRTYYNGRYYGNFNNRFYGPQYGYF
jgi:hypothetical protein